MTDSKYYPNFGLVIFKITKTRNIRISIKSDLQITVSFSKYCSLKKAEQFFVSKTIWVENALQKMAKRQEIKTRQTLPKLLKLTAEELLDKKHYLILRCHQLAAQHNFKIKKVLLKKQKTIWGSCSVDNKISLNVALAFLSDQLIDYVILHELVHTKVKNHSRNFWNQLEELLPGAKILNQQLKAFGVTVF